MRLTKAIINTSNLNKNFLNIRKKVGNVKVMAVVKADAYGHGVRIVVDELNSLGNKRPDYFAVATADEGIELRKLKIKQPILIFDPVDKYQVYKFLNFNLIPYGIFTHFATSDEAGSDYAKLQIKRFNDVINSLKHKKINFGFVHAANSGAIIDFPESYYDMVRPGISLYGYYPSLQTSESIKLYPVMSLVSKVSTIKKISKMESISYSRRYFTKNNTKIISVPIGYADGFPRSLTNKAQAIIKGKIYNQVGTVTMDRIMFDVGNDNIKVNDDVILLGKNGKFKIDAWDWSKKINTIPYEITCGISKRVPRVVKN